MMNNFLMSTWRPTPQKVLSVKIFHQITMMTNLKKRAKPGFNRVDHFALNQIAYKAYDADASKIFTTLHTLKNKLAAYKKEVAKAVASISWDKTEIIKTER